jgi:hypothetical protein
VPSILVLVLQYCYLIFCIVLLLPLTLPIDGADWSGQFEGWTASSWAVLVLVSSFVCVGANYCIQASGQLPGAHTPWSFCALCAASSIAQRDFTQYDRTLFVPSPLQHATWQLGAPTLSMFYGLRLVASIVESQLLLGYTVITDAVQVGSLDWWGAVLCTVQL